MSMRDSPLECVVRVELLDELSSVVEYFACWPDSEDWLHVL